MAGATGLSKNDPDAAHNGAVSESVGALEILSFDAEGHLVLTRYGENAEAIEACFNAQCDWAKGLQVTRVDGEASPGLWNSVKAHLGAFGVITRIAFKAQVRESGGELSRTASPSSVPLSRDFPSRAFPSRALLGLRRPPPPSAEKLPRA